MKSEIHSDSSNDEICEVEDETIVYEGPVITSEIREALAKSKEVV